MSIITALTRNRAATAPDAPDARLRSRSYPIPFGRVWSAARAVAASERGWTVVAEDARAGRIAAEARTRLWRFVDDVEIRLSLDGAGLTRVDLTSASRIGSMDLGANRRRIARFLRRLDRHLAARVA